MKLLFQLATVVLPPLLITSPIRAEMQTSDPSSSPQLHISLIDRDGETAMAGTESAKGFTLRVSDSSEAPVSDSAVVFRLPDEGPSGSFADASHSAIVYTSADGLARISGIKWSEFAGSVVIKVTATKGEARAGFLLKETLIPKTVAAAAAAARDSSQSSPDSKPQAVASAIAHPSTAVQPGVSAAKEESSSLPRVTQAPQTSGPGAPPAVSVVNSKSGQAGYHSSHKKWIIVAAVVAAAAGAGVAFGAKKKSSSSTTSATGVSVGAPSISVGNP